MRAWDEMEPDLGRCLECGRRYIRAGEACDCMERFRTQAQEEGQDDEQTEDRDPDFQAALWRYCRLFRRL